MNEPVQVDTKWLPELILCFLFSYPSFLKVRTLSWLLTVGSRKMFMVQPQHLSTTNLFSVLTLPLFLECYVNGTIRYLIFETGFFSLIVIPLIPPTCDVYQQFISFHG